MNQEELYQAIHKEDWKLLLEILHKWKNEIWDDPMLMSAAKIFESVFFQKVKSYSIDRQDISEYLDNLYMLHEGNFFRLNNESHIVLISEIVRRKNDFSESTYNYAKIYPNDPVCKTVIEKYEIKQSKEIKHSQSEIIQVLEKEHIDNNDFRIHLFKSAQEKEFFLALKQTFDSYQIYPNVAASCLLDWEPLSTKLTPKEKEYFFKCIIDFVVFDQAQDYLPIHFFELDSPFHDSIEQKEKDELKNSIFSKAGIQIYRIRKNNKVVSIPEFVKLIREIFK